MSDTQAPEAVKPVSFNNTWKATITLTTLLFNASIIVYCVLRGEGPNPLHASALGYAFLVNFGILVGIGIGSVTPDVISVFKR